MINSDEWREDKSAKSITFFSIKKPSSISKELIEELKRISKENGKKNARFCLHENPEAPLHDMIILEYRDKKCRKPHKHLEKNETLHMIEGKMIALFFDDEGKLMKRETLNSEDNFAYHTPIGVYHVWLPLTEYVVYREIKQGPFKQEDNISPEFNHVEVLKKNVDFMSLDCYNDKCNYPCSLKKI